MTEAVKIPTNELLEDVADDGRKLRSLTVTKSSLPLNINIFTE